MIVLFISLVGIASAYCPNGYTFYESTQKCYKVVEEPSTYFAAADACTLDDGQLVSIHNAFENTYVSSLIEYKYADHWIGLTSMISGWNYTWLDNSAFSYDRFSPSPPNRDYHCVVIKAVSSVWATAPCASQLPSICIYDPAANRTCPTCPTPQPCPTCATPLVEEASDLSKTIIKEISLAKRENLDVVCPPGYTYVDIMQRCYKVVTVGPKTFFGASNACNLDGAELVSIHSLGEGQAIGDLLPLSNDDKVYWIGLTSLIDSWEQWTWLDDTSVRYANWAYGSCLLGRPDNNLSCAVLHSLGLQWTTELCNVQLPYICEFDPTKTHNCPPCPTQPPCPVCPIPICDIGWKYFNYTDSCYFIGTDGNVTNTLVQDACKQRGSYLSSIHSDAENSFILNYAYSIRNVSVWIGLYRTGSHPTDFANYDGTPVDYTHWSSGEPNNAFGDEYCTEIYINSPFGPGMNGYWNDRPCDTMGAVQDTGLYACKKPANKGS